MGQSAAFVSSASCEEVPARPVLHLIGLCPVPNWGWYGQTVQQPLSKNFIANLMSEPERSPRNLSCIQLVYPLTTFLRRSPRIPVVHRINTESSWMICDITQPYNIVESLDDLPETAPSVTRGCAPAVQGPHQHRPDSAGCGLAQDWRCIQHYEGRRCQAMRSPVLPRVVRISFLVRKKKNSMFLPEKYGYSWPPSLCTIATPRSCAPTVRYVLMMLRRALCKPCM
jgi:hypothetical protein